MSNFVETEFPIEAKKQIIALGGKPQKAYVKLYNKTALFSMVSIDLDKSGNRYHHASLSASTMGVMRFPEDEEIKSLVEFLNWDYDDCVFEKGSNCIHVYKTYGE